MLQTLMNNSKDAVAYQKQLESLDDIDENVVFYMVGIKPNASRLSLKFIDRKRYSDDIVEYFTVSKGYAGFRRI